MIDDPIRVAPNAVNTTPGILCGFPTRSIIPGIVNMIPMMINIIIRIEATNKYFFIKIPF